MSGNEIRERFLKYMQKNGHVIVPSAPLIPQNDPTTLFTGSGMQPLVPYLMGEKHPMGTRVANSQKCFRAEDIDEVGDNRHTTFFEMLGNWSFGDYFKDEEIPWLFDFLITEIKLDPKKMYVTVFGGDTVHELPKDTDSAEIWVHLFSEQGISNKIGTIGSIDDGGKRGMKDDERIFYYDTSKNWWSRSGIPEKMPIGEIGGPDTEIFYDFETPHDTTFGEHCHPNCDCGRFIEIGNSVFIQYTKTEKNKFAKLPKRNVDFGGGLERIAAAALGNPDIFTIDILKATIQTIERLSGKSYSDNKQAFRIITDHIRGAVFMISEAIYPSNTEQGYFTRRLLRRAIRYADILDIPPGQLASVAKSIIDTYKGYYEKIEEHESDIVDTIRGEEDQFRKTLEKGLKKFNAILQNIHNKKLLEEPQQSSISGEDVFELFTTYGFPIELTEELAHERGVTIDRDAFTTCMDAHKKLSRAGAEQKFRGGLADHSEKVIMYHTATHLLLAGLRKELGETVHQTGSNITNERLRFDFTYSQKVSDDILRRVEMFVNNAIQENVPVSVTTITKSEAEKDPTIEGSFWDRYPDVVKIYTAHSDAGIIYSRELCGGPHVLKTGEIIGSFKIIKEESVANGVRRIKAVLE